MKLSDEERLVVLKGLDGLLSRPKPHPNQTMEWRERTVARELQTRVRLEA